MSWSLHCLCAFCVFADTRVRFVGRRFEINNSQQFVSTSNHCDFIAHKLLSYFVLIKSTRGCSKAYADWKILLWDTLKFGVLTSYDLSCHTSYPISQLKITCLLILSYLLWFWKSIIILMLFRMRYLTSKYR